MRSDIVANNLYQLPNCSICLQELNSNLINLACGHTFHEHCIEQHFNYKGTCPNCQKRAQRKEVRPVVYPVTPNSAGGALIAKLLGQSQPSEAQQISKLLEQIKILSTKEQKLVYELGEIEKELKRKQIKLSQTTKQLNQKLTERNTLLKENHQFKKIIQEIERENQQLRVTELKLRTQLDESLTQRKQVQHYKTLKRMVDKHSEQIYDYKVSLEKKQVPPSEMASQYFDMLCLKNLQLRRIMVERDEKKQKSQQLSRQVEKVKDDYRRWKQKFQKCQEEKDQLKARYQERISKLKARFQIQLSDDSIQHSVSSKRVLEKPQQKKKQGFHIIEEKQKTKKISGSSFGGWGKKKSQQKSIKKFAS